MTKIIDIKSFGDVNRDISTIDRPQDNMEGGSADVAKDTQINPLGRLVKRDGYLKYYSTRPILLDWTTLTANRFVRNDAVTNDFPEVYNSHRRKTLIEAIPNTYAGVSYLFNGIIVLNKRHDIELRIYRGITDDTTGETTWGGSVTDVLVTLPAGVMLETLDWTGDNAGDTLKFIDYSMVYNSNDECLYIAVLMRDDISAVGTNWSNIKIIKVSDIFTGNWGAGDPSWTDVTDGLGDDETIDGNDALMGLDLTLDGGGFLHLIYEYYDATQDPGFTNYLKWRKTLLQAHIDAEFDSTAIIINSALGNIHGGVIECVPGGDGTEKVIIGYLLDIDGAAADSIYMRYFAANSIPPSEGSAIFINVGFNPATISFRSWCGPSLAIDNGGNAHFLYRSGQTTLQHTRVTGATYNSKSTKQVTANVDSIDYTAGGFLASYLPTTDYYNWDFVVKDDWVTVYFVEDATPNIGPSQNPNRLVRKWRIGTNAFDEPSVPVEGLDDYHAFLSTYRKYEAYGSRRLSYVHTTVDVDQQIRIRDIKFLRNSRTMSEGVITIEAMGEFDIPQKESVGAGLEIAHIIQCSDSRYYKRNTSMPEWMLLENTMDVDNADECWWKRLTAPVASGGLGLASTPNPNPHARMYEHEGVVRAGIGSGDTEVGIHYGLIDRYFFSNDEINAYRDQFLDVPLLQSPGSGNLNTAGGANFPPVDVIRNDSPYIGLFGNEYVVNQPEIQTFKNYRPFARRSEDGTKLILDPEFEPNETFLLGCGGYLDDIDEIKQRVKEKIFFVALSFIYDGYQETPLFHISDPYVKKWFYGGYGIKPPAGYICVGARNRSVHVDWEVIPYIVVRLQIRHWNSTNIGRCNPRLTAVRIHLAEIYSSGDTPEKAKFYPVKEVLVSNKDKFKYEPWNGESQWGWSNPYFQEDVVIDLDDWLAGLRAGCYSDINGHSYVDFKYEAEKGLELGPFPEGYKFARTFGDNILIANVRINGVTRKNRAMCSPVRSEYGFTAVMHDLYTKYRDFDFDINGLEHIDDDSAAILGANGEIAKIEVPSLEIKSKDYLGKGAIASDSIFRATDQGIEFGAISGSKLIVGDAYKHYPISDPIERNSEDGVYLGLAGLTTLSDAYCFYLPKHRKILLFFPTQNKIYEYDLRRKGWRHHVFRDNFVCGCVAKNGNLHYSDGSYVYAYPIGILDDDYHLIPIWRSSDLSIPEGTEVDLEKMHLIYKLVSNGGGTPTTLKVSIIRDRGGFAALVHTFVASPTPVRIKRNISMGYKVQREVAVQFELNTPSDAGIMEIEEFQLYGVPLEKIT